MVWESKNTSLILAQQALGSGEWVEANGIFSVLTHNTP